MITERQPSNEVAELRTRLQELQETLRAIRAGQVDAVLISSSEGDRVFTLQGSDNPYRVLVEKMNEGAATLDSNGTLLFANPQFARMLNRSMPDLIGASLTDLALLAGDESLEHLLTTVNSGPRKAEGFLRGERGNLIPVNLSFSPLNEDGFQGVCLIITDLTQQKKREQELAKANQQLRTEIGQRLRAEEALRRDEESLRQLSARLLQLQDEERRRIARDLHESTGQKAAALCLDLMSIMRQPGMPSKARGTLEECSQLAEQMTAEMRTLSYLLHPPLLDEVGFRSAAQWYIDGFERRTRIKTKLVLPDDIGRLPHELEITLFRILQESLTNVHRHSGSSTAEVRLTTAADSVTLEVKDQGTGCTADPANCFEGGAEMLGVGIRGMRERVRQLGGCLEVTSDREGTLVKAILPLACSQPQNDCAGSRL
jgi:PAS domain S-box-containing protein